MSELVFEAKQEIGKIICNIETVRELAISKAAMYRGIIVTDDTTIAAKKDIADLRKLQKDINDAKIQVKKEFTAPLTKFEAECKDIIALLDEPINFMESQVKEYEAKKKEEKKAKIVEMYHELTSEYASYLPITKYYKPQWENNATSQKSIEKDIVALVDQASMSVMAIKATESEFVDKGLEALKDNLDVSKAMIVIKGYEAQKREILEREERRKREEEERKQRVEEERIRAEEEARKQAENLKQMKLEADEAFRIMEEETLAQEEELPFIPEEEPFVVPSDLFITKRYVIKETPFTHSCIEEELIRLGVAFVIEEE